MAKLTHSDCFDTDTQSAYVGGALDRVTSAALLRHMAVCTECAAGVGRLLEQAEEAEMWTARAHGEAWRDDAVVAALAAAMAGAAGALRAELERWARQGARAVYGTVRAVGRESGAVIRWIAVGVEAMGPAPAVAGFPTRGATRTRGAIRARNSGSRLRRAETIQIPLGGGASAQCAIEGADLVVRFPRQSSVGPAPVVLVIPKSGAPPFGFLGEQGADRCYVARAVAPTGDFEVTLGPVGRGAET